MRLSKELITEALEIYNIIESLKPPDELHQLLHCKKRSKRSTNPQRVNKKEQAQMVIPYYWPLEQRTNATNAYLLAMCYHVKFHDSTNSDSETQVSLIVDSGASISISPHLEDFVTEIRASRSITLQGIGGGCEVEGIGTVTYCIPRLHKPDFTLWIENTLYVPSCPSHLLCPQQLHEQSVLKGPNNANFITHAQGASLTHEGEHFDFPFHQRQNYWS